MLKNNKKQAGRSEMFCHIEKKYEFCTRFSRKDLYKKRMKSHEINVINQ